MSCSEHTSCPLNFCVPTTSTPSSRLAARAFANWLRQPSARTSSAISTKASPRRTRHTSNLTSSKTTPSRRTTDMALSNRDRIDRMFQVLAPALDDFISTVVGQGDPSLGAVWTKLVQAKDSKNGAPSTKTYDALDPQVQFRILTEGNITGGFKAGWYPFNQAIGRTGETFASELREVRNEWAHNGTFTDDDAYRALDTGERLLKLIGAAKEADA